MNKSAPERVEDRFMRTLIPLLLLGLAALPAVAKPPRAASARGSETVPTILVLGDSLSAGYGLRRSDAYPALLSAKATAHGQRLQILNEGVNGDTTAGGLRRLPRLLERRVDVLVIELGINDAFRGLAVTQIEANLQKMIDLARARHPKIRIVLAGMQLPQYSGGDYLNAFGAIYADLARRNTVALVPFLLEGVAGNPTLNLPDFIHPNAEGQKVLAANVWPVLESVLPKTSIPGEATLDAEGNAN